MREKILRFGCSGALIMLLVACGSGEPSAQIVAPEAGPSDDLAERILNASIYAISADEELDAFVTQTAQAAITEHCAACHGADLTGKPGVANLVDFDWLWGITFEEANDVGPVMEIQQTILYGIRNRDCPNIIDQSPYGVCPDTRFSEMPGYGVSGAFDDDAIADLTEYVIDLSGGDADPEAVARASENWAICTECHGTDGAGYKPYGGPDLTDDVWLYGGDRMTISDVIRSGRQGVCPPWADRLDAATIKALAVYIWRQSFGG